MAIEIVDFPMKNGDFPWQNVSSPEGMIDSWELHQKKLGRLGFGQQTLVFKQQIGIHI